MLISLSAKILINGLEFTINNVRQMLRASYTTPGNSTAIRSTYKEIVGTYRKTNQ